MRKLVIGSLAIVILASLAWAAGDPWKAKPYTQWDEKDVRKILSDSPWSKIVQVPAAWSAGGDSGGSSLPNATQEHSPDGGVMGQGTGTPKPDAAPQIPQATFAARWVSSRTIREALLRSQVLGGQMKEDEAEKRAALAVDSYQMLIAGPDMKPFQGVDEKALLAKTYLNMKKSKQKIPATGVEFERGPDGKTVLAAVFIFPKKMENGEPTIATDEKGAEFNCSIGGTNIRAAFEISKMDDSQGRDL
ncbi:MAG: hypothetical protein WB780_24585 [Candidatus Acidiferrales bacterium]